MGPSDNREYNVYGFKPMRNSILKGLSLYTYTWGSASLPWLQVISAIGQYSNYAK